MLMENVNKVFTPFIHVFFFTSGLIKWCTADEISYIQQAIKLAMFLHIRLNTSCGLEIMHLSLKSL